MPYMVAVYDIHARRVTKVMKVFRRYLHHVQRSVFEGELTAKQQRCLEEELRPLLDPAHDQVVFYQWKDPRFVDRTVMGADEPSAPRFLLP